MIIQSSKFKMQNCNLKFKIFLFVFSFLTFNFTLLTFNLIKVNAQSLSLSIYPPLLEVMIKPGKSITQVYKLINNGETDLVMTSKIVSFEPADELGNIKLGNGNSKLASINDYFSFQNADLKLGESFTLKAGAQQQIVLKISAPQDAPEKDYYLTLLFETNPQENLYLHPGGVSSAQAKIGSNILLTVSETGEPPRKAETIEFKLQNAKFKIIDSFTKPQFVLRIKNTGRSLFKPMGTITLTGWLGQKYLLNLLPENILSGSIRKIGCSLPDNPEVFGSCQIKPKFLLGFYQAKAEFGLEKISNDYTTQINFIALPIKLILALLGLAFLLLIVKLTQSKLKYLTKKLASNILKSKEKMEKKIRRHLFLVGVFLFSLFLLLFFFKPTELDSASLTSASATLSNPRLSFYAVVDEGADIGDSAIDIKTTGNYADKNTNHLFPKDNVAVGNEGNLTVASIIDSNTFVLSAGLTIPASDGDPVYATQSGTLTVTFKTTNTIPAGGDVLITIPDPAANGNDGAPDTADSSANNGFDFNGITTSNITCPSGGSWTVTSATAGSGSGHTVVCTTSSEIAASTTLTIIIGDETKSLVNPAPVYSGHTQGLADTYTVSVQTRDSGDREIDSVEVKVAPVEAVLVSATVDETLTFQIQGVNNGVTACGQETDVTTTAYSVPWGLLSTADSFKEAAQQLTVSTNAESGYTVKIEENDQMGKNGVTCSGSDANEDDNCIQDTTCSASGCSESTGYNWTNASTYHGLGYSLQNVDGSDAVFVYNSNDPCSNSAGAGTFCAKQLADQESSETKATIMCGGGGDCSSNGPVNSKDIYVCYRIAISAIQPAGYYYNKVKYTATATF